MNTENKIGKIFLIVILASLLSSCAWFSKPLSSSSVCDPVSVPGRFDALASFGNQETHFYALQYNKEGKQECLYRLSVNEEKDIQGLAEREDLITLVEREQFSDIYFFSHGWNNTRCVALHRYKKFSEAYANLRKANNLAMSENYKPLMLGVIWPSTTLIKKAEECYMSEAELAGNETILIRDSGYGTQVFYKVKEPENEEQFAEIMKKIENNEASDQEVMRITDPEEIEEILAAFYAKKSKTEEEPGILRLPHRVFTAAIIRDRAGVVGYQGVGKTLEYLLTNSDARIHLIGHSYGAKVMLSALSRATENTSKKVHSALLLQPAISRWAFTKALPNTHPTGSARLRALLGGRSIETSGGYHNLPDHIEAPIFSTYSNLDKPLSEAFHTTLHFHSANYGERYIGDQNNPKQRDYNTFVFYDYTALGGHGLPNKEELKNAAEEPNIMNIPLESAGRDYDLHSDQRKDVRIFGLDGGAPSKKEALIKGHGDIISAHTAWALYTLVCYRNPEVPPYSASACQR